MSALVEAAELWIGPYWNARHLERTRDWLLVLDPTADEALVLAALTHDMERHFPGGPSMDPATMPPDDPTYRQTHSDRSARIVSTWLRDRGAEAGLLADVDRLIRTHETGGTLDENLLQASDSLSFLEVNDELVARWYSEGRCGRERARNQLTYMFERIQVEQAVELARPLYAHATATVDAA